MLPDDVLLDIFDFCKKNRDILRSGWKWHLLVHVCPRWRQIVFASRHRLNLQILCTSGTPAVRANLRIWPPFPIIIDYRYSWSLIMPNDEDNVIAALDREHLDRICSIRLYVTHLQLGKLNMVMKEPFPALECLEISSEDGNTPVLSGGFLGGSAPRLLEVTLSGIPYPALPSLLLSASNLVELRLHRIPPTGYISPEAMVTSLAALPKLKIFIIKFQLATPRPDPHPIHPPAITRTVLPALTSFQFRGSSGYLEDLTSRIDTPYLKQILIEFLNQLADVQVTHFSTFIDHSVGPEITQFNHAQVSFFDSRVAFTIHRHATHPYSGWHPITTTILCEGVDWQVWHMAHVLSQISATLSNVVHLKLKAHPGEDDRQLEDRDGVEWRHLLHQFSAVQTLHVSQGLAGHVSLALEDVAGETVTEVLPSLGLICLAGQPASSMEKFVAGRQLSHAERPVAVVYTEREFDKRVWSHVSE
jgi:hypothetical protein